MLLLLYVFAASTISLWENAQSTNMSDDHSNSTVLSLRTLPPRLDITASIAPSPLEPQVFASNETKLEDQDSEERVRPPLPPTYPRITQVDTSVAVWQRRHPKLVFNQLEFAQGLKGPKDRQKLFTWLQHIESFRAQKNVYSDTEMLKLLETKVSHEELMQLMRGSGVSNLSARFLRLLVSDPTITTSRNIKSGSVEPDLSPGEIYYLLPIGATKRLTKGDKQAWGGVYLKIARWFMVVESYPVRSHHRDKAILNVLVENRGEVETMAFLRCLHRNRDMKDRAKGLQRLLGIMYPDTVPKLTQFWFLSDITPDEVFQMMPIAVMNRMTPGDNEDVWRDIVRNVKDWYDYVKLFQHEHQNVFNDNDVVKVLVDNRGVPESMVFLILLGRDPNMKDSTDRMRQMLMTTHPDSLNEMLDSCLMADISPDEVFWMMPIPLTHNYNQDTWSEIDRTLRVWYAYVYHFRRKAGNTYTGDSFMRALVQNRGAQWVEHYICALENNPKMNEAAGVLRRYFPKPN